MIYSKLYLQERNKVPPIVGILFVVFAALIFLRIFSRLSQPSKALNYNLRRLEITNISSFSAAVFWQTEEKEVSWILYGDSPDQINKIIFDDRDISSKKNSYFNHYATLSGLKENKRYYFKIITNNKVISKNRGEPFSLTTSSKVEGEKKFPLVYGRVIKTNGEPLEGAVVLLSLGEKVVASSLTKLKGEWLISLNAKIDSSQKIKIEIISEDRQISTIYTNIDKISPLPQTIIIGKNYDFTKEENVLSASFSPNLVKEGDHFEIIYPKEKASIPGKTPLIKGVFLPEGIAYITIKPKKTGKLDKIYSAKVKADKKGLWIFSPSEPLRVGEYVLTFTGRDKNGKEVILERNFVLTGKEASTVDILGEATPSATISPSPPIVTPTFSPPSLTPSPLPTEPLLTPTLPSSGINFVLPALFGISFFIIGLGIILVF